MKKHKSLGKLLLKSFWYFITFRSMECQRCLEDFEIQLSVKKIIEVKAEYMLNDELTLAKIKAMKEFAVLKEYGFWLVTESVLDNLEIDKQEEVLVC